MQLDKKILYVVDFELGSNAMTQRVKAISALFQKCGFKVHLVSTSKKFPAEVITPKAIAANSITYPLANYRGGSASRACESIFANKAIESINELTTGIYSAALVYGGGLFRVKGYKKACLKHGIPLMIDETDWLNLSSTLKAPFPHCAIRFIDIWIKNLGRRFVDPSLDGQITISRYLQDYYSNKGNPFFLPPLIDENEIVDCTSFIDLSVGKMLRVVYAGSPGVKESKDLITPFLKAIERFFYREGRMFCNLDLVGMTEEDLLLLWRPKEVSYGELGINTHGKVPHDVASNYIKNSDIGLLLRRNQLYARAGFSTKFVEYLAAGTPVLCNAVGGADTCISTFDNGFLLSDLSDDVIDEMLLRIDSLTAEELNLVKQNSVRTAQELFIGSQYIEDFSNYMNAICSLDSAPSLI